ncbi:MAG: hypothetical protein KC766_26320 [Myxococcales bacterium]|nr:hypothetical protein [Myxococcales bacterium]
MTKTPVVTLIEESTALSTKRPARRTLTPEECFREVICRVDVASVANIGH